MDPGTASLIAAGITALGSGLTGANQAKMSKEQLEQQRRLQQQQLGQNYQQMAQNERQYGQTSNLGRANQLDQRAVGAADLQRRRNLAPISDQAAFYLQQRAGASPQAFQPRDFTRGTMPGRGNVSGGVAPGMAAAATAMEGYKPGMGGLDMGALEAAIKRLRDESLVPGEYTGQNADQMRYGAEMQGKMMDAANSKYAKDRIRLQTEANQLAGMMGGGQAAPSLLRAGDEQQAQIDAQKAAAKKRLMGMIGLGAAGLAVPGIGALLGGAAAQPLMQSTPLLQKAMSGAMTLGMR